LIGTAMVGHGARHAVKPGISLDCVNIWRK
jgi:hypothetical protein